jgi:hypothetical protein
MQVGALPEGAMEALIMTANHFEDSEPLVPRYPLLEEGLEAMVGCNPVTACQPSDLAAFSRAIVKHLRLR